AITLDSSLAKLLLDATMNNGSIDDFIDGTPWSSIQMPFDVVINGQTITIRNKTQLEALAQISPPITLVFPITVVFEDISTLEGYSREEVYELDQCCQAVNNGINCVDLV